MYVYKDRIEQEKELQKQLMSKFKIDINGKFYNQNLTGLRDSDMR